MTFWGFRIGIQLLSCHEIHSGLLSGMGKIRVGNILARKPPVPAEMMKLYNSLHN
jgi:hypothetical protein